MSKWIIKKEASNKTKAYNLDYVEAIECKEVDTNEYWVALDCKSCYDYILERATKEEATALFDKIMSAIKYDNEGVIYVDKN